ncbi:MAG: GNAT family N-acetyltransferase [Thermoleophilia bacterium]|nr:GNAT family N-acetyltransferase [Thermoleophilia bacterium]
MNVDPSIRELAENPNVHQPLSAGRELVTDPDERFAIYLGPGTGLHTATVQRVRLEGDGVEPAVEEIRALVQDKDEPVAIGMVLIAGSEMPEPPGTSARRVESVDELVTARRIQDEAFGDHWSEEVEFEQVEADFAREGIDGSMFLAFVDGAPVAAGYASYTPLGFLLFGGATLPSARGRGAYRALVAARAREAMERGTPVVVTHAGKMSRPILERLGCTPVARIDRLLDVFPVETG